MSDLCRDFITQFLLSLASFPPAPSSPVVSISPTNNNRSRASPSAAAAAAAAADSLLLAIEMAPPIRTRVRMAVGTTEDYEETCYLGRGTYGSVVKARHRATGKTVAIKRLGEPGQAQSEVIREVGFLASCSGNPFVVGFHGVVCAPGSTELRLVMECVGPSLRDVFNKRCKDKTPTPLPEAKVRAFMWQLLTGVKKMHAIHLIHRDIKPDNVLVSTDESVVKICDLGLAVHMSDAPPYDLAGTRWYMAPEMLLGRTDYDALVDTWSLGCVMAELIGGDVLFQGDDYDDQLCSIIGVLGVPDQWPWFASTPFANTVLPRRLLFPRRHSQLRKWFPETALSEQGFEVLSGLLAWNPDKRLTASAALRHPWFAVLNTPTQAGKREFASSALPKTNLHKRQKLQCA